MLTRPLPLTVMALTLHHLLTFQRCPIPCLVFECDCIPTQTSREGVSWEVSSPPGSIESSEQS